MSPCNISVPSGTNWIELPAKPRRIKPIQLNHFEAHWCANLQHLQKFGSLTPPSKRGQVHLYPRLSTTAAPAESDLPLYTVQPGRLGLGLLRCNLYSGTMRGTGKGNQEAEDTFQIGGVVELYFDVAAKSGLILDNPHLGAQVST
jgi:hypothetical protein